MPYEIIVMGASMGGLRAISTVLSALPTSLPTAIAIVQHRHRNSHGGLSAVLQEYSIMPIIEPEDKQPIAPGMVYLAPADYHLLVETNHFAL